MGFGCEKLLGHSEVTGGGGNLVFSSTVYSSPRQLFIHFIKHLVLVCPYLTLRS